MNSGRFHAAMETRFGAALLIFAWAVSSAPSGQTRNVLGDLAVSACAGGLIALNRRLLSGVAAAGLAILSMLPAERSAHINLLVPIAMLASACLMGRVLLPRIQTKYWPAILGWLAVAFRLCLILPGVFALVPLIVASLLVAHASFQIVRTLRANDDIVGKLRYSLADQEWLADTSRHLLLGRIAGGMAHELSQAMNVIAMANGNLGYILAHANIEEPFRTELHQRVNKIAQHSASAAAMLSQFRWFGVDGIRDGQQMTVGTALERAMIASRSTSRKNGLTITVRGDALGHPAPLRHGLIELLTSTALSEVARIVTESSSAGKPPESIALEATRTQSHIEIAVVCRQAPLLTTSKRKGIDQITYDLVSRLAASAQAEIRRLDETHYPVLFILRLPRDTI